MCVQQLRRDELGPRVIESDADIPTANLLAQYRRWQSLSGGGFPHPDTFDATEQTEAATSWVWLDVLPDENDYIARFVGPKVDDVVGNKTTGMRLSEMEPVLGAEPLRRLFELVDLVRSSGKPVAGGPRRTAITDKEWVTMCSVCLPFSKRNGALDRILIAIEISM